MASRLLDPRCPSCRGLGRRCTDPWHTSPDRTDDRPDVWPLEIVAVAAAVVGLVAAWGWLYSALT